MSHTVTAVIDKLRMWSAGKWKTYDTIPIQEANIFLRIHYDQLFILYKNKVLESLNLNGKNKGIYKDDMLILIICYTPHQVRKIKFRIKTNIAECFHKFNLHFPVVSFNDSSNPFHQIRYKTVEEVLRTAVEKGVTSGQSLPPNFTDFVKLCLLDPSFPNIVDEVQDIIKNKITNI